MKGIVLAGGSGAVIPLRAVSAAVAGVRQAYDYYPLSTLMLAISATSSSSRHPRTCHGSS
jgi:hypothetical protein